LKKYQRNITRRKKGGVQLKKKTRKPEAPPHTAEQEKMPVSLRDTVRTNRFTKLVIEGLAEMGFQNLNGLLWQYVALVYASVQTGGG
jgi:hypothetical protein